MQVELVAEIDRDAECLRVRSRIRKRGPRRLLHDIAHLPGEIQVALARHGDHLDRQQHAANLGPGEPVGDADQRFLVSLVGLVAWRSEQVVEPSRRDRHPAGLALDDLARDLAAHAGDRAFQVADAGLAGVAVDHRGDRRPGDLDVLLGQAVIGELLGDQELARDHHLFLGGVAGEVDHFHPIEQRPRDRVVDVRRGDEQDFRKIEGDFQVVIREVLVLFRVKDLEHRRGGIPSKIR